MGTEEESGKGYESDAEAAGGEMAAMEERVLCAGEPSPRTASLLSSGAPNAASSFASSLASSGDTSLLPSSSSSARPPAGPGTGLRPSRNALAMSEAFHFAYLTLSRF